ncbi:MAG: RtcB family protein, partial [Clostridiales bacterium]|nr:RtcB family protein [Clostridiales bacterium]
MEIRGRHNAAVVYAQSIDPSAQRQIEAMCDQEFLAGSRIRIMPDVHAGAGCTIGTTMTIADAVVPNFVGVDIGCGMETARLAQRRVEPNRLDRVIREGIPSGFAVRDKPHPMGEEIDLGGLRCARAVKLDRAYRSIGRLGGGNHFIEVGRGEDGELYLVVHSGSRHLGVEIAQYYQEQGYRQLSGASDQRQKALVRRLKAEGRGREIPDALRALRESPAAPDVPRAMAYVSGALMDDYLHDMRLAQRFADLNRRAMVREIVRALKLDIAQQFTTVHNYIDLDAMVLRKGAVSAREGERLLIPINMRDGSLICVGKGNADWNCSAPHGAGRLMSRAEANQRFTVSEFKKQMAG